MSRTLGQRLWSSVTIMSSGCWEYSKYRTPKGYGEMGDGNGGTIRAHRAAWLVTHGSIPDDEQVLHKCDNPPCCNPAHLFLGSAQDNTDDMHRKGRARKAQGFASGQAFLTSSEVDEIRRLHVPGRGGNTAELALAYGISKAYVGQLSRGVWRKNA